MTGSEYHFDFGPMLSQPPRQGDAVHCSWHVHVGENNIYVGVIFQLLSSIVSRACLQDIKSLLHQKMVKQSPQEKAIAHPTDSRLLETARTKLVEAAIALKQTFAKKGEQLSRQAGRYAHARQFKRMRRKIKHQRTIVERLVREIDHKASVMGRGVDAENSDVRVVHRGKPKRLTAQESRQLKRRQAIEPIIGHLKADHRMDRCHLKGEDGDRLHAVLCAAGYNIKWLLRMIARKGVLFLWRLFLRLEKWSHGAGCGWRWQHDGAQAAWITILVLRIRGS